MSMAKDMYITERKIPRQYIYIYIYIDFFSVYNAVGRGVIIFQTDKTTTVTNINFSILWSPMPVASLLPTFVEFYSFSRQTLLERTFNIIKTIF